MILSGAQFFVRGPIKLIEAKKQIKNIYKKNQWKTPIWHHTLNHALIYAARSINMLLNKFSTVSPISSHMPSLIAPSARHDCCHLAGLKTRSPLSCSICLSRMSCDWAWKKSQRLVRFSSLAMNFMVIRRKKVEASEAENWKYRGN